mmetsp:Transcript_29214/g.41804  ORF Transcript_29214/g.41804 Transcript_29214/m.41804 type:complete len:245 (+) Transcript_29214:1066-1800(+)
MLSVPHKVKAILSGYMPSLSSASFSNNFFTTSCATSTAAVVGIDDGSNACMFRPVGRTSGLRIGSPPGAGIRNSPFSNCIIPPSSLFATICFKQNSRYLNNGTKRSSFTFGNPAFMIACVHGFLDPVNEANIPAISSMKDLTSFIRPVESVDWSTRALTAQRDALTIFSLSSTSLRIPLLFPRYTSLISRPMEAAITRGRPSILSSGLSNWAMLTKVAIASSADGGMPTVCKPQGNRRLSICII